MSLEPRTSLSSIPSPARHALSPLWALALAIL